MSAVRIERGKPASAALILAVALTFTVALTLAMALTFTVALALMVAAALTATRTATAGFGHATGGREVPVVAAARPEPSGRLTAVSGVATSSSERPSALTPSQISTRAPMIITAAPIR